MPEPEEWIKWEANDNCANHGTCNGNAWTRCNHTHEGEPCCRRRNPEWDQWKQQQRVTNVLGKNAGIASRFTRTLPNDATLAEIVVFVWEACGRTSHPDYRETLLLVAHRAQQNDTVKTLATAISNDGSVATDEVLLKFMGDVCNELHSAQNFLEEFIAGLDDQIGTMSGQRLIPIRSKIRDLQNAYKFFKERPGSETYGARDSDSDWPFCKALLAVIDPKWTANIKVAWASQAATSNIVNGNRPTLDFAIKLARAHDDQAHKASSIANLKRHAAAAVRETTENPLKIARLEEQLREQHRLLLEATQQTSLVEHRAMLETAAVREQMNYKEENLRHMQMCLAAEKEKQQYGDTLKQLQNQAQTQPFQGYAPQAPFGYQTGQAYMPNAVPGSMGEAQKPPTCYTCGKDGHYSRLCPDKLCYTCGEKGHISSMCSSKRRGKGGKGGWRGSGKGGKGGWRNGGNSYGQYQQGIAQQPGYQAQASQQQPFQQPFQPQPPAVQPPTQLPRHQQPQQHQMLLTSGQGQPLLVHPGYRGQSGNSQAAPPNHRG